MFFRKNTSRSVSSQSYLSCNASTVCCKTSSRKPTFAGADGLKHHFCSSTFMQSCLLIQQLLLLHLLLLLIQKNKKQDRPRWLTWNSRDFHRDRRSDRETRTPTSKLFTSSPSSSSSWQLWKWCMDEKKKNVVMISMFQISLGYLHQHYYPHINTFFFRYLSHDASIGHVEIILIQFARTGSTKTHIYLFFFF